MIASISNKRRAWLLAPIAIAFLATFGAIACSGGGGTKTAATSKPQTVVTVAPTPEPTGVPDSAITLSPLSQTFWYAGWKVTIANVSFTGGQLGGGEVTMDATFENLGNDTATFDAQIALERGGLSYGSISADTNLPRVPGKSAATGIVALDTRQGFTLDNAVIVVGNPADNQARLSIGEGAQSRPLQPQTVPVTGAVTAGGVTLAVAGAESRADIPETHREVAAGKRALTINFSAAIASGVALSEDSLKTENLALKLPDGTTIAAASGPNELLQGKDGTTIPGLSVRFEVPDSATGSFALILKGKYDATRQVITGELPFTVQ